MALHEPGAFGAAFPIGGLLAEGLVPAGGPGREAPPTRAFHCEEDGEEDRHIPVGPTRAAVAARKAAGFDAALVTDPGVGHQLPAPLRADRHAAIAAIAAIAATVTEGDGLGADVVASTASRAPTARSRTYPRR